MHRRRFAIQAAVVSCAAALLVGCAGLDPMARLEDVEALPLWQKVAAVALSTLISEDLACIAGGILASKGVLTFGWALLAGFLGIYLGDIPLYLLGRLGGMGLLRRRPFRWFIKESQVLQAEELFRDHGGKLIFSSRLLPGSRVPVYVAAGVLRYPFWKFAVYMAIAGGISSLLLTWASMRLGEVVFDWLRVYEAYFFPVAAAMALAVWIVLKLLEVLATRRSRLVLLSRTRRLLGLGRRFGPRG
jgi:membrane protein DedA with SNARE-associated domain